MNHRQVGGKAKLPVLKALRHGKPVSLAQRWKDREQACTIEPCQLGVADALEDGKLARREEGGGGIILRRDLQIVAPDEHELRHAGTADLRD